MSESAVRSHFARTELERALPAWLVARRWFRDKSRGPQRAEVKEVLPLATADLAVVDVVFEEGPPASYVLPIAEAKGAEAAALEASRVVLRASDRVFYDALASEPFLRELLSRFGAGGEITHGGVTLKFQRFAPYHAAHESLTPRLLDAEQTNSSIVYGESLILKLFRKLDEGTSADLEMGRFLTDAGFAHAPAALGALEIAGPRMAPSTLGIVQAFVPNRGDAWRLTQASLELYFEDARQLDAYLPLAELLGKRTAEMHRALGSSDADAAFAPEPISLRDRESLFEAARAHLHAVARKLRAHDAEDARAMAHRQGEIEARLQRFARSNATSFRTRVHGDFHLGQVLYTGDDFVIIDFEGEPARPLAERKAKRSPLVDVAGMLRSFHYAAVAGLRARQDARLFEAAARAWHRAVADAYLGAYLVAMRGSKLLPEEPRELRAMLDFHQVEKCIYEVAYEIDNRPRWLAIPLEGLRDLLEDGDMP